MTPVVEMGQDPSLPEEIWQREQCRALCAALPLLLFLQAAAAAVLGASLWSAIAPAPILGWLSGFAAASAGVLGLWLSVRAAATRGNNTAPLLRRFRIAGLVQGLLWGAGIVLLLVPGDPVHQGFLALTIAGVAGAAAVAQSSDRLTVLAFVTPPLVMLCLILIREDTTHAFAMSAMSAVYLGFLALAATRSERRWRRSMAHGSDAGPRSLQPAASESRLHHLLSAGPAVVFSCAATRDAPLTYVSPNLTALFGYAPSDLLGGTERWLRHVHPEDAAAARERIAACIEFGAATAEYRFRHQQDGWRWILDERVVTRDATGRSREIVGVWSDITARKTAEERVHAQSQFQQVVAEISANLIDANHGDLAGAIDATLRQVGGHFRADRAYVFQVASDGATMDNTNEWCAPGIPAQIRRLHGIPTKMLPWQWAQLQSGPLAIADVDALPGAAEAEMREYRRQGIRSLIMLPMRRQGEFIGFFGLDCTTTARSWTETDAALLKIVAGIIAGALARARSASALEQSNELLDSVVENIPAMVFLKRAGDLRFERFNRAGEKLLGYTRDEYLGKNDYDFFPKDQADQFTAVDRKVLASEAAYDIREEPILTRDKELRYLRTAKIALRDAAGKATHLLGISVDITDTRRAEAALRQSQERLMDAQRIGCIGYWTVDLTSGQTEWSDVLYEIYGRGRGTFSPTLAVYFESIAHPADLPLVQRALEEVLTTGRAVSIDHRFRRGDGSEGWVHLEGVPEPGQQDRPTRLRGTAQDITARKTAELALQQLNSELEQRVAERTRELSASEKRLKHAHRIARLASWEYDLATLRWHWSEEFYQLFGLDPATASMTLEAWLAMVHPEDRTWVPEALRRAREAHRPGELQYRIIRPDGETRVIHAWGEEVDGKRVGLVMDVTEQVRAERSLADAQRIANLGSWEWIPGTDRLRWSQQGLRIFGYAEGIAERPAEEWLQRLHAEDRERVEAELDRHRQAGGSLDLTYRIVRPDGAVRTIEERIEFTIDAAGVLMQNAGIFRDITESRQVELAMQAVSHDLIALEGGAFYDAAAASLRKLVNLDVAFINRREGERPDQMALLAVATEAGVKHPGFYELQGTPSVEVLAGNAQIVRSGAWLRYPADPDLAGPKIEAYAAEPIRDHTGRIIGLVGVLNRRPLDAPGALPTILSMFAVAIGAAMGREQIHRRDAWLRAILQNTPAEITIKDLDLRIMASSGGVDTEPQERLANKIGKHTRDLFPPEVAEKYESADRKVLATGKSVQQEVVERVDGRTRIIQNVKFPMRDEAGGIVGVCSISTDVTELRQTAEKLAQAQKMEALGTLTGGIAHDFNNYLAVILGNLDLLDEYLDRDPKAHELIGSALHGAIRSQELTRSLLAFARHQPLEPKIATVGDAIRDTAKLLERTLGEDIAVTLEIAPDLWPVLVDLAQLASCIVNLAKNARDAMAQGGRLTICARNIEIGSAGDPLEPDVKPGQHVMIEVSDTGAGIAPKVLANVFEPFFTTKPPGHGTGLGLSMVYGFVTQSGGDIKIRSRLGEGTQVRIYLPRAAQPAAAPAPVPALFDADMPGGSEVILLVEDNRAVRQTVAAQLKSLGYQVVEAASGDQAAAMLERADQSIALILSDVVMPGQLDGYGLARHARARRPDIKVLLMSGFPGERGSDGDEGAAVRLLAKPYRKAELARALRDLLDAPPSAATARAV